MHWRNLQMKIKIVTNPTCTWPAVNVSVTTTQASLSGPALVPVTAHGWLTLTRGWPLPTLLWHLTLTLTRPQVSAGPYLRPITLKSYLISSINSVYFSKLCIWFKSLNSKALVETSQQKDCFWLRQGVTLSGLHATLVKSHEIYFLGLFLYWKLKSSACSSRPMLKRL